MGPVLKIIFRIFICLLILFAAAMVFFFLVAYNNNSERKSKTEVLKSGSSESKKALVVYQPSMISDCTKAAAYEMARGLNSKGYDVTLTYPGKNLTKDISGYSVMAFGSPVYIGQTSSVLNDYIKGIHSFAGKKIILFTTGAADDSAQLDAMEKLLKDADAPMKIGFISKETEKNKAEAYKVGCDMGSNSNED
jgi:flavorubredoxin